MTRGEHLLSKSLLGWKERSPGIRVAVSSLPKGNRTFYNRDFFREIKNEKKIEDNNFLWSCPEHTFSYYFYINQMFQFIFF